MIASQTLREIRTGIQQGVQQGWKSYRKRKDIIPLFLTSLIAQCLLLGVVVTLAGQRMLEENVTTSLELSPASSDQKRRDLYAALRSLPFIEDAHYVTREQLLEEAKTKSPTLQGLLERRNISNPFHDRVTVTLVHFQNLRSLRTFVQEEKWATSIEPLSLKWMEDEEMKEERSLAFLGHASWVGVALLILATVALIGTACGVGASPERHQILDAFGASPHSLVAAEVARMTLLLSTTNLTASILPLSFLFLMLPTSPLLPLFDLHFSSQEIIFELQDTFLIALPAFLVFLVLVSFAYTWLQALPPWRLPFPSSPLRQPLHGAA